MDTDVEIREGRAAEVGGMRIARVLPTKGRRTVGPWCFVDLMSPGDVEAPPPMEIGPHPHTGLATVTWLFEGTALHGDSLGTEQLIRPGQLNLMTAGDGIAHSELGIETTGPGRRVGDFSGVQMWIAQPESTRHTRPRFEHLSELPRVDLHTGEATVLVGELGNARSAAETDWPVVGLDVQIRGRTAVPPDPDFEYAVVPIDQSVRVSNTIVEPGSLALLGPGPEPIDLAVLTGTGRALVLGGAPLGERIQMWWNFVARSRDEITEAWRDWQSHNTERFGPVPSDLRRIEAPTPPWITD